MTLLRVSLSGAFLTFTLITASAQSSTTISKQFHGAWGRGLGAMRQNRRRRAIHHRAPLYHGV